MLPRTLLATLVLAMLAIGVASPHATDAGEAAVQGDVTCSGVVDSVDSLQVLRSVAGLSTNAKCLAEAGDVDCDDDADSTDSLRILRYVASLAVSPIQDCTPIGDPLEEEVLPPGANSYQVIEAARQAGEIDSETALTYKIFMTFGDPRLPEKYRGDDSAVWDDPGAMSELVATFDTLSPPTKTLLAPYMVSPDAENSWQQLRFRAERAARGLTPAQGSAGIYLPIEGSPNVVVWYRQDRPQDAAVAEQLATEVDTAMWNDLVGLFGPPKADTDRVPMGVDGRPDVYLTGDPNLRSFASPTGCQGTSAYTALGVGGYNKYVLLHELTHIITFGFTMQQCEFPEYRWFNEATAQWSMDFIYPDDQQERGSPSEHLPKCFLNDPQISIEYRNDCREYGVYVFAFFLHRYYSEGLIRSIWDGFATKNSLVAVNAALASKGGLKELWPEFALENYNREPQDAYQAIDDFHVAAKLFADEQVSVGGGNNGTYTLRGDVEHLGAIYHRYRFVDGNIQKVTFTHALDGQETAVVTALIKYEGSPGWETEYWEDDPQKIFCYEVPGTRRIEELAIIITNSEYQNRNHVLTSSPQPTLKVDDTCEGAHTATYHFDKGFQEDWTVEADVLWVEDPDYFFGCNCRVFFPDGFIDWRWELGWDTSYADPACHETDSGTVDVDGSPQLTRMLILWEDPQNDDIYHYSGEGQIDSTWHSECENGDRQGFTFFAIPAPDIFSRSQEVTSAGPIPLCHEGEFTIPRDATTITGSCYAHQDAVVFKLYKWNFSIVDP